MGEIWLLALCEVLIRQIVQDAVCTLCLLMFWKVWTLISLSRQQSYENFQPV